MAIEEATNTQEASAKQQQQQQSSSTHENSSTYKNSFQMLFFGQFLAMCLAATGAASTTLSMKCGVSAPAAQTWLVYVILSLHLLLPSQRQRIMQRFRRKKKKGHMELNGCQEGQNQLHHQEEESDEEEASSSLSKHNASTSTSTSPSSTTSTNSSSSSLTLYSLWVYLPIAFLDVEANYLVVLAYKYTSFTSVTLLTSLAIPTTMISSNLFLNRAYHWRHLCGVGMCLLGLVLTVLSDAQESGSSSSSDSSTAAASATLSNRLDSSVYKAVGGDLLAVLGALLYGLNDALAELSVKTMNRAEFLGMLGFCASILSIPQVISEWDQVQHFFFFFFMSTSSSSSSLDLLSSSASSSSATTMTCTITVQCTSLILYITALVLYYTGVSYFLLYSDAALLNLSLLGSNLYAMLYSSMLQQQQPPPGHFVPSVLFMGAMVCVVGGVVLYEMASVAAALESKWVWRSRWMEDGRWRWRWGDAGEDKIRQSTEGGGVHEGTLLLPAT